MQTTLLGMAIAVILALITALAGPYFIDWDQYREEFETQASRMTGLEVRIAGPIEARLLPTPALSLQRIEVTQRGNASSLHARSLGVEFALGALLRGELRASDVRLESPDITAGLDARGRLEWPLHSVGIDLDMISIDQLEVIDGRISLADATSGSHLVLEKFEFKGELRSLAGPVKGEGAFVVASQHYPYRVAASRVGDDGGVRVRLNIDPIDRPLIVDLDTFVFLERGIPRFDGNVQLARPVGQGPQGITEPWHLSSHIKGDSTAAILQQIEFQYGPDDRAIRLRGDANLAFGGAPQLGMNLSATQVDLDRALALPETMRRRPLLAVKALLDCLGSAPRLPIPVRLAIGVENAIVAGAVLQRVSGELKATAASWRVERLEFRAPGATQVQLSGRLETGSKGITFSGPANVESRDSRALVGWLANRVEVLASGSLHAQAEIKVGGEMIAIEALKADLDRIAIEGRLAYSWGNGGEPPRLDAALDAPQIDVDYAYALAQDLFGDNSFAWPREGALAVKIGRASVAGVEAKGTEIAVRFDRASLDIERLVVADLGGAALAVKGAIDLRASVPRGTVAVDLDARALDGVAALVEKFAPPVATEFRRRLARFVPAALRATLSVTADPAQPAGSDSLAALKIDGSAGTFRIGLLAHAAGTGDVFTSTNLARLGATKSSLAGSIEAGEGSALVNLLGFDRWITVDNRPARLDFKSNGPFNSEMGIEGHLIAGGLDASTQGTWRVESEGPVADLAVEVVSAHLHGLRPATTLPAAVRARLRLARGSAVITDLVGNIAGADLGGRLKIGLVEPATVDGDIELGEINLPAAIAAVTGAPVRASAAATVWPAEPFEQGLLGKLEGRVTVKMAHVTLTPMLAAKQVRGSVQFDQSMLTFHVLDGGLAGGRVAGNMMLERASDGISVRSHLKFVDADLAELIRGGPPPLTGRLSFNVDLEGSGRSPVAVIGSLNGGGTFMLQDGNFLNFDPAAFEAVIRSVDQGLPIDASRVRDRMEQALASGAVAIPPVQGKIAIMGGQARLNNLVLQTRGAELAIAGNVALAEDELDAKVTLVGPERADAPGGIRPEVGIAIKGPLAMPKRSLDAAAFANWLALRAVEQQTKRLDALESGRDIPSSLMLPERSTATVPAREPLYENPLLTVPRRNVVRTPARPRSAVQPAMPSQAPLEMRAPAATVSPRQAPAAGSSAGAASSVEP